MVKKDLNGIQKVAVVLLSLSEELAASILSRMDEDEIREISYTMSRLGNVENVIASSVAQECIDYANNNRIFHGNLHNTIKLMKQVLDEDKINELLEHLKGPEGKNIWEKLEQVNEGLLAAYLKNEHPQTAALILSKISPDYTAKIFNHFNDQFAFEVISRILDMGEVKRDVLDQVEKILKSEFITTIGRTQKSDSAAMLAEIFNNFNNASESRFMSMLEANIPEAAAKIKDMMFTFNDIIKLDQRSIIRLLKDVERYDLTFALKGTSDELKNIIFSGLSKRAVEILQDDIQTLGRVRLSEVETARSKIVNTAKRLIDNGEIEIFNNLEDKKETFVV